MKTKFTTLLAAGVLAVTGATALGGAASAESFDRGFSFSVGFDRGYAPHHRGHRGWNGPEGHFIVYARSCPDIREDRRDRRVYEGRRDIREDRRDRRILDCPPRAWDYVPSRRELRQGRTGDRLRPTIAYLDRRSGQYFTDTRWGAVPVYVVRGRAPGDHRRGHRRYRGW
ncbi:MAG: hypothetical protein AAFX09_02775 [Pseudomonadota bacterium]